MKIYSPYRRVIHIVTAKYFRGYGVHSPFVYGYIRNVVIRHKLAKKNDRLFLFLKDYLPKKYIAMIANSAYYLHVGNVVCGDGIFRLSDQLPDNLMNITDDPNAIAHQAEINIAVHPYKNRVVAGSWKHWYEQNDAVILDFGDILIIFTNKKLKKQYYRIRK